MVQNVYGVRIRMNPWNLYGIIASQKEAYQILGTELLVFRHRHAFWNLSVDNRFEADITDMASEIWGEDNRSFDDSTKLPLAHTTYIIGHYNPSVRITI